MVGLQPARRPWLPPLPTEHHCDRRNVALVDDPDRQTQFEMEWVPGGGHLLLAGSVGSGLTTALLTLGAAALNASDSAGQAPGVHLYVIDGIGDERLQVFEREPRCAGVVRLHERERLMRLLHRLVDEVRVRAAGHNSPDAPAVLLFVDGIDAVRRHLDDVDTMTEFEALTEVIAAGAAVGVHVVMTTTLPGSLPLTMLAACGERWVFSLTDAHDALSLGVRPADVPAAVPGRFVTASTGLEGQLGLRALSFAPCVAAATPTPLRVLPAILPVDHLDAPTVDEDEVRLPLGAAFQNGRTAFVEIPDGEHLLVVGPSRSGRSAVLCRLAAAWARANHVDRGDRAVVVLAPRRSPVRDLDGACVVGSMAELLAMCNATGPQLLVIDDAELVDDVNGAFAAIIASHRPGLLVIAAGRPDALRQSYGHWTSVVRRSRLGIVAAGSSDLDGDLVGALLPRRLPVSPRPGLMYIVDNGSLTLVQTALDSVPVDA
jgi:S-DNA-T family DNA segregation ATPase FtsK/SpoIIIE